MSDQTRTHRQIRIDRNLSTKEQLDNICDVLEQQSDWLIEQRMLMQEQQKGNKELMELYGNLKGFLTVASWFERLSVWALKMAAGGTFLWGVFKFLIKESTDK